MTSFILLQWERIYVYIWIVVWEERSVSTCTCSLQTPLYLMYFPSYLLYLFLLFIILLYLSFISLLFSSFLIIPTFFFYMPLLCIETKPPTHIYIASSIAVDSSIYVKIKVQLRYIFTLISVYALKLTTIDELIITENS